MIFITLGSVSAPAKGRLTMLKITLHMQKWFLICCEQFCLWKKAKNRDISISACADLLLDRKIWSTARAEMVLNWDILRSALAKVYWTERFWSLRMQRCFWTETFKGLRVQTWIRTDRKWVCTCRRAVELAKNTSARAEMESYREKGALHVHEY